MTGPNTFEEGQPALAEDDCLRQLERILASSDFEATPRENRFLRYVAEEALAGRENRIKAYSIAVEVFGRDSSFDPQKDPIVRIEAGHLRRSLERYYLTAGLSDPIIIKIPKGAYVPTFTARPAAAPSVATVRTETDAGPKVQAGKTVWLPAFVALLAIAAVALAFRLTVRSMEPSAPEIPRILVQRFDDLSATGNSAAIATGLTQEIVGQLAKFKDIVVLVSVDTTPGKETPPPRFVLAGSVSLSPGAFRLRVRLINQRDQSVLWAQDYDGNMEVAELLAAQADIASNVATSLAQIYGVIFQADSALNPANPPDDWAAYACTLSYYEYRATMDANALPAVRTCLEQAIARFPAYATAWGLLSQIYIDEVRFTFPYDPVKTPAAIERSLAASQRAVELDPLNIRGLQGEMLARFFGGDIPAGLAVGKRAMALNPNDTDLMGEYGYRLGLSGNWKEGCALVPKARDRNPGPLAYYETGLALCAYFAGDYPQAANWIKRTDFPSNANYHAIAAAIFGEGGYKEDADRERLWLEKNAQALLNNVRQEVAVLQQSQGSGVLFGITEEDGIGYEPVEHISSGKSGRHSP